MTVEALFLYGTLRHAPLLTCVAGCEVPTEVASLTDHAITHAETHEGAQQDFPLFTERAGAMATGLLARPNAEARARLDAYERVFGYDTTQITVDTADGPVDAIIYVPRAELWMPGRAWSLETWVAGPGQLAVDVAGEVMALLETTEPEAILARFGMLEMRAASRQRAISEPAPTTLRRQSDPADVVVEEMRRPYTWFFGVEEADLSFRRFDGTQSVPVTRAGFIMADAVTILPYDPQRDTVMLVEQFRFGPYARGDRNPWLLEPIAGRIDPGETPEDAARRETLEETRLTLHDLHQIGRYYVSPGSVTEYLISYVALADLPQSAEGVGGVAAEAEDIRAHVIPFAQLMALIESGEIEDAPLLISAQWLAMNRERLRG
ncbi:NUDIX domain-containing protein [Pararhodobacter oceanensis]|uniref:NUDIX domain-containing protein n=1 Tax=Pararhodobacter oceanensis TaxID=2172121 RepID=UPI003A9315DF